MATDQKQVPECRICKQPILNIIQALYHLEEDEWSHHRCIIDQSFEEVNRTNR